MSLPDYLLDEEDVCERHGLSHCRICREQKRQEAAVERMEAEKERDDD